MKAELLVIGKTSETWLIAGIEKYRMRVSRYIDFDIHTIADIKSRGKIDIDSLKRFEAEKIMAYIGEKDKLLLLDERGKEFRSVDFAHWLEQNYYVTQQRLIFVVGGAYGFCDSVYKRANHIISLSMMTFSHQMARLFFVEQLYRALTIIKNEPYHHE